jgi:hypothetical protein
MGISPQEETGMVNVPWLGQLNKVPENDSWLESQPVALKAFHSDSVMFVLQGFEQDALKQDFTSAINALFELTADDLLDTQNAIYQYYQDVEQNTNQHNNELVKISAPNQLWDHLSVVGGVVLRNRAAENEVYISLNCRCAWEPTHGLQIVFIAGRKVCKVGMIDGHLTNALAYDDPSLEGVIYCSFERQYDTVKRSSLAENVIGTYGILTHVLRFLNLVSGR